MASNSNSTPKWILYVGGFASIATIIGVIIAYSAFMHSSSGGSSSGVTINNNMSGGTPLNTNNTLAAVAATPTPNPTWNVILNRAYDTLTYNNYTVNDTQGHHFLIVDASFSNLSSSAQSLTGGLFDLQDENGQRYTEDQASNPGQSFAVDPNKSIETVTSFVVPDASCKFELSFSAGSSVVAQWTINSSMCS